MLTVGITKYYLMDRLDERAQIRFLYFLLEKLVNKQSLHNVNTSEERTVKIVVGTSTLCDVIQKYKYVPCILLGLIY